MEQTGHQHGPLTTPTSISWVDDFIDDNDAWKNANAAESFLSACFSDVRAHPAYRHIDKLTTILVPLYKRAFGETDI